MLGIAPHSILVQDDVSGAYAGAKQLYVYFTFGTTDVISDVK